MKAIDLIFGYRNREPLRVQRCLDSLARQTDTRFSVLLVDYGSDASCAQQVEALCGRYPFCRYVFSHTRGRLWNRSHALNTGIRLSEADYVVTTDIDLVYPPNFVALLHEHLAPGRELHANAYALPEKFADWNKLHQQQLSLPARDMTALGLVQGLPRYAHQEVGGFDEHFSIWGEEDRDLRARMQRTGISEWWLSLAQCPIYHQWHPSAGKRTRALPLGWRRFMGNYFTRMSAQQPLQRNPQGWGRLLLSDDRPAYQLREQVEPRHAYSLQDYPALYFFAPILQALEQAPRNTALSFSFRQQAEPSRLERLVDKANDLSNRLDLPLMLDTELAYFGIRESAQDAYDALTYVLYGLQGRYQDYCLERFGPQVRLVLVK